jgi:alpha-methylacyl-CoA racemase
MGPLTGVRILEFSHGGPASFAGMLLAELGADVLRIERPSESARPAASLRHDVLKRSRPAIGVDLQSDEGRRIAASLAERADAIIEGFRPGVMERMGIGPQDCLRRNPRIVYCRVTGWGQEGPLAERAAHDLNFIALTGALEAIGRAGQPPTPPLNLVGTWAGGGLYAALGLVAAVFEARQSAQGQVVDVAMVDGIASLLAQHCGLLASGEIGARGENLRDSGAPFYDVYACADGQWLSVAAVEPERFASLLHLLAVDPVAVGAQWDKTRWAIARALIAGRFASASRDHWVQASEDADACVTPVLDVTAAAAHPHLRARGTFVDVDGVLQPGAAPRFSRTVLRPPTAPMPSDNGREDVLRRWGVPPSSTSG